jgi:hypothetical protein
MSAGTEHSHFNLGTELVSAWLLFGMFFCLTALLYYLTVVRVPPRPLFEKYFSVIAMPVVVYHSLARGWMWVSNKSQSYVSKLRAFNKEIEMKPLTAASSDIARTNSEDMAAAIIGVPLEEDEEISEPKPLVALN